MEVASLLRRARAQAGLSLRELAIRAHTSHSTLAAYETGHKVPRADTLIRVINAAGYDVDLKPTAKRASDGRTERGEELVEVLRLAEQFPARHEPQLTAPRFGKTA